MWRPKEWLHGGGYQDEVNGEYLDNFETMAFEAGTDAMLSALREKHRIEECVSPDSKGVWVFIPDEKTE